MNKNYVNAKDEKKKKEKKKRAAVLLLAGLIGAGALGGLLSTSAFFTDRDQTNQEVNVGTLDMKLDDLSDLDGNFRTWSDRLTSTSALTENGLQSDDFTVAGLKGDATSAGIINPGDSGILAFKVSNVAEKSMDTAAVVTVEVKLPEGAYNDTNASGEPVEANLTASDAADAGAYTIEGLGVPVVHQGRLSRDANGRLPLISDTNAKFDDDKNTITLQYYTTLETLKGKVEANDSDETHGAGNSAIYAYNTDFDRALQNKFQNATITVDTQVLAKQHRDSFTDAKDFTVDGGSQGVDKNEAATRAVEGTNGQVAARSNINQTHVTGGTFNAISDLSDWSMIGSFAHVVDGSTTSGTERQNLGTNVADGLKAPEGNVTKGATADKAADTTGGTTETTPASTETPAEGN